MARYENGKAPLSDLIKVGDQQYLPAGTCARWREMQRLAWEKYRVWLVITPGWNGYRPLDIQVQYREELGIWAAVPGTSSHGLTFNGRDCAAIDVYNWRDLAPGNESLAWARFVALCRLVGFTVDFVTPRELWHIGDFDPFTVPAFAAITINPSTTAMPAQSKEDDMPINFRRESTGVSYTMIPGYGITAHANLHGFRLTAFGNTGAWPAAPIADALSTDQRIAAGERQFNDDNLRWWLALMDFAWVAEDLNGRLPKPSEYRYADRLQKIYDAAKA
ncbi:MAG: hypothetical protein BGO45_10565 [Microbacterium sp. 71-36]|uniref:hypothetical protein n=1 Tax=unclassified Microbacterium TaxID=2609290 RepID=UPI0009270BBE|nr:MULTISPECIES: hypothetical protein [unclassified Microbacterium]MBN9210708.1 hypothetical protein [Microbacterium sp.]OJV77234.1 MAG: hypothetical protein BGO45_10565 [Microbacterium sp. 71-36]